MAAQTMRAALRAVFLCVALIFSVIAGPAEARNPYEVTGVKVDATAKSASEARDIAIRQGLAKAFRMLVTRSVPAGEASRVPTPPPAELDAMVASFGVDKEKRSATRYLAELSVTFKSEVVRDLFARQSVRYSESLSQPVLIIPIWTGADGETHLWGGKNLWRQGWEPLTLGSDAVVPVVLPKGAQTDMRTVSLEVAQEPVPELLMDLARQYRLGRVAVMDARVVNYGAEGTSIIQISTYMFDGREEQRFSQTYEARLTGSNADLVPTARAMQSLLAERWKSRTLVSGNYEEVIRASVPIVSIDQWIAVEARLREVPSISSVSVDAVGTGGAAVTLSYRGSINQLTLSLRESDLILDRGPSGGYRILSSELR